MSDHLRQHRRHQPTPRRFRLGQPGLHRLTPRQQPLDLGDDPFLLGEDSMADK